MVIPKIFKTLNFRVIFLKTMESIMCLQTIKAIPRLKELIFQCLSISTALRAAGKNNRET
jgi:hypothetical protein